MPRVVHYHHYDGLPRTGRTTTSSSTMSSTRYYRSARRCHSADPSSSRGPRLQHPVYNNGRNTYYPVVFTRNPYDSIEPAGISCGLRLPAEDSRFADPRFTASRCGWRMPAFHPSAWAPDGRGWTPADSHAGFSSPILIVGGTLNAANTVRQMMHRYNHGYRSSNRGYSAPGPCYVPDCTRYRMTPRTRMAHPVVYKIGMNPSAKLDHFTEATLGPKRDVATMGLRDASPMRAG